mgnify:CR=1 FL=1
MNTTAAANASLRTIDMGNNETRGIGIDARHDGSFCALTLSQSKTFKTAAGAARWLAARGYGPNGQRLAATTA